jgi:hypothetical protein
MSKRETVAIYIIARILSRDLAAFGHKLSFKL